MTQSPHAQPLMFDEHQTELIDGYLTELSDRISAPLILLADVSGQLIHYYGRLSTAQSTGLAALAAGGFAATSEIGNFLGLGDSFKQQLLEGRLANLYTMKVGDELLLIIAFTDQTTLGMVRVIAEKTQKKLLKIIEAAKETRQLAQTQPNPIEQGFQNALEQELDDLFTNL